MSEQRVLAEDFTIVEFRPYNGLPRQLRATPEQLHGQACIACATGDDGTDLVYVGRTYYTDAPPGSAQYSRPAVAHPECLKAAE
ncbi:hypothetical protein ACIQC7_28060 [Kitasatospora sp. NPDC088556]|uniref:hypothetical protein n=1 Tax=Kitasatospora sp. NPDC088556 TaxID=3364076 RepID=UPI0037F92AE8